MWCWWRMEWRVWADRVKNEVLQRVNEERNLLRTIKRGKANWIGHILQRNRLLEHPIEGGIEVTGRRGKRRKELPDDLKKKNGYWKLKRGSTRSHSVEDTLCQRLWSTHKTSLRNMNDHQQDRRVEGKITLKRTSRKRCFKGVHGTELAQNKDSNRRLPSSQ